MATGKRKRKPSRGPKPPHPNSAMYHYVSLLQGALDDLDIKAKLNDAPESDSDASMRQSMLAGIGIARKIFKPGYVAPRSAVTGDTDRKVLAEAIAIAKRLNAQPDDMMANKLPDGSWRIQNDNEDDFIISSFWSSPDGYFGRRIDTKSSDGKRQQIAWMNFNHGLLRMRVEGDSWRQACIDALRLANVIGDQLDDYYQEPAYEIIDDDPEYQKVKAGIILADKARADDQAKKERSREARAERASARALKAEADRIKDITVTAFTMNRGAHYRHLKRGINFVGKIQLRTGEIQVSDSTDLEEAVRMLTAMSIIGERLDGSSTNRYEIVDTEYLKTKSGFIKENPPIIAALHLSERVDGEGVIHHEAKRVIVRKGKWIGQINLHDGSLRLKDSEHLDEIVALLRSASMISTLLNPSIPSYEIIDEEYLELIDTPMVLG